MLAFARPTPQCMRQPESSGRGVSVWLAVRNNTSVALGQRHSRCLAVMQRRGPATSTRSPPEHRRNATLEIAVHRKNTSGAFLITANGVADFELESNFPKTDG